MRNVGRIMVVGLVSALVAAACGGGGDGSGTETAQTVDAGIKSGVAAQLGGSTTVAGATATTAAVQPRPKSMDEWEKLWAEQRAKVVKRIKDNNWGKSADGKTVNGAEGFKIDLTTCSNNWSDTEGITDAEIKVGNPMPLSGAAGDYGNIAKAMTAIYANYSKQGAFKDVNGKTRSVNLIVKDDGYDATRTIPLVDEMIDSEKVFAVWTLGSPNGLKVYDKLNARCIPHPLEMSGHPAWGDPVKHPWTTGQQMAYNTEAVLWGSFIENHINEFPNGVKVASLVANSDFGRAYDSFFKAYINDSKIKDKVQYFSEVLEITAPTVTDPMTTLQSKKPDIFITMTGGAQCPQIIQEAAGNGMKESAKYLFMSSVCKAASFVGKDKVGGDGKASDGWWIMGGGAMDLNAESNSGDAYVQWARQLLKDNGIDYKTSGSFGSGFIFAFPFVQAMRTAGELPGGLTRSNFITALRHLDATNPMLLEGIKYNMNGNADAYLTEGSDLSKYDSAKQAWVQQGSIVELSGKSKNCAYDQPSGTCK